MALLCWDLERDVDAARQCLVQVSAASAIAAELERQVLLESGDAASAALLCAEQAARAGEEERDLLWIEVALLWLYRLDDPSRAAQACLQADAGLADGTPLGELLALALLVACDHEQLAALANRREASLDALVAGGVVLLRRFGRPAEAAGLLERAFALDDEDPFILELLLEASASDAVRCVELLRRKYDLVSRHDPHSTDAVAVGLDLACLLAELGRVEESIALAAWLDPSLEDARDIGQLERGPLAASGSELRSAKRDAAAEGWQLDRLASVYDSMAQASGIAAMRRVYRLLGATALAVAQEGDSASEALLRENLSSNPADTYSAVALEVLLLGRGRFADLHDLYRSQAEVHPEAKSFLLRKASIIAEARLSDPILAATLRRDSLVGFDRLAYGDLQRLYRTSGSASQLEEAYRREADATLDQDHGALLWGVIGALRLAMNQPGAAEQAAREALRASPEDPLAMAVLADALEKQGRRLELEEALRLQSELLSSRGNRADALRRQAAVQDSPEERRRQLEAAHALDPANPQVLRDLVANSEERGEFSDAVRWSVELAQALRGDPHAAAEALSGAGRYYLEHLEDEALACRTFERALAVDPSVTTDDSPGGRRGGTRSDAARCCPDPRAAGAGRGGDRGVRCRRSDGSGQGGGDPRSGSRLPGRRPT
jgi:hypothetical protein